MIIFALFQMLDEKAMEYKDVLNACLNKVQQDLISNFSALTGWPRKTHRKLPS